METVYSGDHLVMLREGHWEYVRRVSNRGAVFIVALTESRELVLVEQQRIPVHARCIELPAGILGDEAQHRNERPEDCALRELLEETGYRGRNAEILVSGPVACGMTSEILYLVRVSGLTKEHGGGGVGHEEIAVHAVPLDQAAAWLEQKRAQGLLVEPRIYAALYFLERKRSG